MIVCISQSDLARRTRVSSEEREEEARLALVLKFLKKAARNLLQPMRCPVPTLNPSLPLCSRQELVGHLLHEFVAAYEHETDLLRVRLRASANASTAAGGGVRERLPPELAGLSADGASAHSELLADATERQLEQLLSAFALRKDAASSALLGMHMLLSKITSMLRQLRILVANGKADILMLYTI